VGAAIRAGSDIFRIPLNLLLTLERAERETTLGSQFFNGLNAKSHGQDHTILACWILQERMKGPTSFWYPYISSLPKNPPGVALLESVCLKDDKKGRFRFDYLLRDTLAGKEVEAFAEIIQDDFKSLCSSDEHFSQKIVLKDFVWARFMVSSRVFRLNWERRASTSSSSNEEGSTMLTMVPLADMLNHSESHNCDWSFIQPRFAQPAHFRMIAREGGIGSGIEVCDTYGKKPNHLFLAHYGFALPNNGLDMAEIVIHSPQGEEDVDNAKYEIKSSSSTSKPKNSNSHENLRQRLMYYKKEMSGFLTFSNGRCIQSFEDEPRRDRQRTSNPVEAKTLSKSAGYDLEDILTFLRLGVASLENLEDISGIKHLKNLLTRL